MVDWSACFCAPLEKWHLHAMLAIHGLARADCWAGDGALIQCFASHRFSERLVLFFLLGLALLLNVESFHHALY